MDAFIANIEEETESNDNFRKVLFTAKHSQLVVMNLVPMEDIGEETHDNVDQFIRIEEGTGKAVLNDKEYEIEEDFAIVIPAGTKHNIINTSDEEPMKLYTVYSPPEHPDGTVHMTKDEAVAEE